MRLLLGIPGFSMNAHEYPRITAMKDETQKIGWADFRRLNPGGNAGAVRSSCLSSVEVGFFAHHCPACSLCFCGFVSSLPSINVLWGYE